MRKNKIVWQEGRHSTSLMGIKAVKKWIHSKIDTYETRKAIAFELDSLREEIWRESSSKKQVLSVCKIINNRISKQDI
jgi:hypothetical protein